MKNALCATLIMGAFVVLTSFALSTKSTTAAPAAQGPAWTVSQYQLDRAFRKVMPACGSCTTSFTFPMSYGAIITQVGAPQSVTILVNGLGEQITTPSVGGFAELNPPIIARPGDTLTIQYGGGPPIIAGYTTLPGET